MANKRITDVDFLESLNSDESFFVNQNNTIKQVKKSNVIFDIVSGGTGANNAQDARENLGLGSVATEDIVPIEKGGTGSSDIAVVRENLGITPDNIGAAPSSHNHDVSDIVSGTLSSDMLSIIPIEKGGTGSSDGAIGLKNLFEAGSTILSSYQYGDELPEAGVVGRIFFKKVF